MQFRVVIPSHVKAGQLIRIRCPDGTEGDVKVPKGLKSGDSFIFEMPEKKSHASNSANSSGSHHPKNPEERSDAPKKSKGRSFLDREIVNMQDFVMALGVGLLIGFSIVIGFLFGVLFVTDPNVPDDTAFQMPLQQQTPDL